MRWTVQKIVGWLWAYDIWRAELEAHGMYRAGDGSQIRSTRPGDPTQRAALNLLELPRQCAVVEEWLRSLRWYEVIAAEFYLSGQPVAEIAVALRIPPEQAERLVLEVPLQIMLTHYALPARPLRDLTG